MEVERDIVNALQNIIDDILLTVDLENMVIESLLLDDIENEGDPADDVLLANLNGHRDDWNGILVNILENVQQLEDLQEFLVEEVLLADDRHICGRPQLEVDISNFRRLEDPTFYQHFRMNRQTFEVFVITFGNHLTRMNRLHRLRTGLDVSLMMSLWIMGNISSFRGTGVVFGVSSSVVHFHYLVVIEALREMAGDFIKWPDAAERAEIKQRCERRTGFPGIVGMMDGTLIKITAPLIQPARYFDRHHNYSVNVLAVCDDRLCFRHVYVGEAGSVHDARIFKRSPLYNLLLEREDITAADEHILADSAYPLTRQVLVPYRHNGLLTPRQRRFNYVHSSNRMCIERSFGHLKEKKRRLYRLQVRNHNYAVDHIMASFVLHNFIKYGGRVPDGMQLPVEENGGNADPVEENGGNADPVEENEGNADQARGADHQHPMLAEARAAGAMKREAIALLLSPEGN